MLILKNDFSNKCRVTALVLSFMTSGIQSSFLMQKPHTFLKLTDILCQQNIICTKQTLDNLQIDKTSYYLSFNLLKILTSQQIIHLK